MSWLTGLAGKAEDILNKLDQNASTVLQQKKNERGELETLIEINCDDNTTVLPRISSSKNILSLTKPITPSKKSISVINPDEKIMNMLISDYNGNNNKIKDDISIQSEKHNSSSNISSRASSISSRLDGTVVEKENSDNIRQASSTQSTQNNGYNFSLEKELAATKIVLVEVKLERDELKNEYENLMEQLKNGNNQQKIKELENLCCILEAEKETLDSRNNMLVDSNSKYVKTISELESAISKHHQNEMELNDKLLWAQNEAVQSTQELRQYRQRAQTTLQMKENMIKQLKNENINETIPESDSVLNLEIDQLKIEKQHLQDEIKMLTDQLEQSRILVTKIEDRYKEMVIDIEQKLETAQENYRSEQRKIYSYQDEIKLQNQETITLREEMTRQNNKMTKKLHEKESEITKLRAKLTQLPLGQASSGLEERIYSLTQSLVQKQTTLEALTAERNALRIQLEKLDHQHKSTMMMIRQQRTQIINVNDTDDVKALVPNFLQETPFDTRVARQVKRAYTTLDSTGIRIGVFLRRYPLARIMVIFYVVLLHIWVMIVLLSSTPSST